MKFKTCHFVSNPAEARAICALIDAFALEMKRKLLDKMQGGMVGWDCTSKEHEYGWDLDMLLRRLQEHVPSKVKHIEAMDFVDIANFAAFGWNMCEDDNEIP